MKHAPIVLDPLSGVEMMFAAYVGSRRFVSSVKRKRRDWLGEHSWTSDIEGACGELACARWLGAFWGGTLDTFRMPDLDGLRLEVKTASGPTHHLYVRDDSRDDERHVLVRGARGVYQIAGWIDAAEAKRHREWYGDNGGRCKGIAYWVPNDELRDPRELRPR